MRTAFYVRVSTERQQQAQTIEQQIALLRSYVAEHPDWVIEEQHISEMTVILEPSCSDRASARCATTARGLLSTWS